MKKFLDRALALALLCAALGHVQEPRAAEPVSVSNAWVRAPAPGQKVAGAYMDLAAATAATVTGAASPVAARVELHATSTEGGVMRMRPVEGIALPAGKTVRLAPGGLHLMLVDLGRPLKEGERVPITLSVRTGEATTQVKIDAPVRAAGAAPGHQHH